MNYFSYIISDKKSRFYWIPVFIYDIIFIVGLIVGGSSVWISDNIFGLIINFLILLSFPLHYVQSFRNFKLQEKLLKANAHLIIKNSLKLYNVIVQMESSKMKVPKNSYEAKIVTKGYNTEYRVFQIEEDIIILGKIYTFRIFRLHLKPIILRRESKLKEASYKGGVEIDKYSIEKKNDDMQIRLIDGNFGISSIMIKGWFNKKKENFSLG